MFIIFYGLVKVGGKKLFDLYISQVGFLQAHRQKFALGISRGIGDNVLTFESKKV